MEPDDPTTEISPAGTTSSALARRGVALVVTLLAAAAVAAVFLMGGDDGQEVATGGGDGGSAEATTTVPPTTTSEATTDATAAVAPAAPMIATTSTAAAPPPTTTSVVPPPPTTTTTANPSKPGFTITPSSGPVGTQAEASGAGCTGAAAGVALTILDPSGEPYTGDGASAMPDGTWRVPFHYPVDGPRGEWTMTAICTTGAGTVVVEYEPSTFTVT